jgi:hypothetical protein
VLTIFARPSGRRHTLPTAPVLESWDRAGHPSQRRLQTYLDQVTELLRAADAGSPEHMALDLVVGLAAEKTLTEVGHDLDNYLFPLARHLGADRLDAAFASKLHAPKSTIALEPAAVHRFDTLPQLQVRTTASASSVAWKKQVHDACRGATPAPLPPGPVSLTLAFGVARACIGAGAITA